MSNKKDSSSKKRKMDDTTVFQLPTVATSNIATSNIATSNVAESSSKVLSPKEEYFKKLDAFIDTSNSLGYSLIVGINDDDYEEEDNEDDDKSANYTAEQLDDLRLIIINSNRSKCLDKAQKFAGIY